MLGETLIDGRSRMRIGGLNSRLVGGGGHGQVRSVAVVKSRYGSALRSLSSLYVSCCVSVELSNKERVIPGG